MMKKIAFFLLLVIFTASFAFSADDKVIMRLMPLDPEKNAFVHNNYGIQYLNIGQYGAAIEEFKIAIGLNPDTQATALFLTNLGDTYMKLGNYTQAQDCYERAIDKSPLNFKYYQNLVLSYKAQGLLDSKLKYYRKYKKSPLDDVKIGLILVEKGKINEGIVVLDNFIMNEPKLFITDGVKYYLNELIDAKKKGLI